MHVAGGSLVVPYVAKAVEVARQRGAFVIWVGFVLTGSCLCELASVGVMDG